MYNSQRQLFDVEPPQKVNASGQLSPSQKRKLLEQSELTKANTTSTRSATAANEYQSVPTDFNKSTTSIITTMTTEEHKLPTFGAKVSDLEHFKMVIVGDRSVGKTCLVVTYGTK
jgi:hypothetical protein